MRARTFPKRSSWSLSYIDRTPAPATPRRMLAPAPLKSDLTPSALTIWRPASSIPLYFAGKGKLATEAR